MTTCSVPLVECPGRKASKPGLADVFIPCEKKNCPFEKIRVHKQCFDRLEIRLVEIYAQSGAGRYLADKQREQNLWTDRANFLKANLKCQCGGTRWIDKHAAGFPSKKPATPENPPKAKSKPKLPTLNVGNHKNKAVLSRKQFRELDQNDLSRHHDGDYLPPPQYMGNVVVINEPRKPKRECKYVGENESTAERPTWVREHFDKSPNRDVSEITAEVVKDAKERFKALYRQKTLSGSSYGTSVDQGMGESLHTSGSASPSTTITDLGIEQEMAMLHLDSDESPYRASEPFFEFIQKMGEPLPSGIWH